MSVLGKKIVFVHPPDIVKGELRDVLSNKEFEIYILTDDRKIKDIYSKYNDTIFFINVDEGKTEPEWQNEISKLTQNCPAIQIGIFSFNISDPEMVQRYLLELGAGCGFIQLKQGIRAATDMMLKVFEVNEVKGRRKYIRYQCQEEDRTSVSFSYDEGVANGTVVDVSSVGMSCSFEGSPSLVKNQMVRSIQIKLRSILAYTDAILMGTRELDDGTMLFVFLFSTGSGEKLKNKLHSFISTACQRSFEKEFALANISF